MSLGLFSCMRDEGVFLLEWLAYHRVIGFERIVIATNDCRDGSDAMLDHLQAAGILRHLRHTPAVGEAPQESGMRAFYAHDAANCDWVAHIDADEFLWLDEGVSLRGWLEALPQAEAVALPWCLFGDSGLQHYPGATLPHFLRREHWPDHGRDKFKSLFRPAAFAHAHDHMPIEPRVASPRAVSTLGEALDATPFSNGKHHSRYRPLEVSLKPGPVRLNHYATRSSDAFAARQRRGDGQGNDGAKYRLGSRWHRIANQNAVEDRSMLRLWPEVEAEMARLRSIDAVAMAERQAIGYFATQVREGEVR